MFLDFGQSRRRSLINSQTKRTKYEGAKVPLFAFLQCQKVSVHKAAVAAVSCMKMPLFYFGELNVTCSNSLSLWAVFQGNRAVLCLTKVAVSSTPFLAISIGFLCKSVENGDVKTGSFLTFFSETPPEIVRFDEKDVKTMSVLTSLFRAFFGQFGFAVLADFKIGFSRFR